jgi:transposase
VGVLACATFALAQQKGLHHFFYRKWKGIWQANGLLMLVATPLQQPDTGQMQLKTIFNRITNDKPFVVGHAELIAKDSAMHIELTMRARGNGRPTCSGCGDRCSGYDTQPTPRRFDFIPIWMIPVVLIYTMRRVNCSRCGVTVERVPWSDGKSPLTPEYRWFLAGWARRMSWKEVSSCFAVSWDHVYNSVKYAVSWGLSHRDLSGIESIGVDEVQWHRGHKYQTLVYQIDQGCKRLLWIGPDRTAKTLLRFFRFLGKERSAKLQFVCSDMWQAYLKVIAKKVPHAIPILDRFHVMQKMSKAIDKVRAGEVRQLKEDGYEPILKGSRWLLLKRPENMTANPTAKLDDLLQYNLKSVRSHLMKEDFQRFREYTYPACAGKFLDGWCTRAMRSQIEPMKSMARTLRKKRELLLNWFHAGRTLSSGVVEGFNNKRKLINRKPYGFRTQNAYETALHHTLGALPEPEFTHRFF